MHTRPEDIVAHDANYNLFVRLPTARTLTLRNLTKHVSVAEIRDRLEIQAGLPCPLYDITLTGGQVLDEAEILTFGKDLRNGALLKTALHAHFEPLFRTVRENEADADVLYGLITGGRDEQLTRGAASPQGSDGGGSQDKGSDGGGSEGSVLLEDLSNAERCFTMLYLAAHFGHHIIVKLLLQFDPEGPQRTTCFGRTALHAAAANDQLKIVQVLLHLGAAHSPQDAFGKTPLDYARDSHACTCERVLKYKSQTLGRDLSDQEDEEEERRKKKISKKKREEKEKARVHIRMKKADGAKDKAPQEAQDLEVSAPSRVPPPAAHTAAPPSGGNQKLHWEVSAPSRVPPPAAHTAAPPSGGNQKLHWGSSGSITVRKTTSSDKTKTRSVGGAPGGGSAPDGGSAQKQHLVAVSISEGRHSECSKRPTFVAVRRVPLEEQRLVTMEFTPMERARSPLKAVVVARPRSSHKGADKHAWAEKVVRGKVEGDGDVAGVKGRTQSAQYYKTKYHQQDETTDYRERPATAGPRFRFWKTWLMEKLEQEAIRDKMSQQDQDRRKRNMAAYRRWLAKKERDEVRQEREESSESSDEEENLGYGNWPSPREMAYKKWLDSKRSMIIQMTRRKQKEEEQAIRDAAHGGVQKKDIYDRRSTVFEIGCTDPTPMKQPSPTKYIGSYKAWLAKKKKYEDWKAKNGALLDLEESTGGDISAARYTYFMEGMTYEEWMGMKLKESKLEK